MKPRFRFDWRLLMWYALDEAAMRIMRSLERDKVYLACDFIRPVTKRSMSVLCIP